MIRQTGYVVCCMWAVQVLLVQHFVNGGPFSEFKKEE